MKTKLICVLVIMGWSAASFAADLTEEIRCVSTYVEQYLPKDQPPEEKKVVNTELVANREMTKDGDYEVYSTTGTFIDGDGKVISTYTSLRRTKRIDLSETQYKEISTIESKTAHSDPNTTTPDSVYQLVTTYEIQVDGTKKVIKMVRDGEVIELKGIDFSIIDRNEVEYTSSFVDQPEDYQFDHGVYRIELSKQICTITKK